MDPSPMQRFSRYFAVRFLRCDQRLRTYMADVGVNEVTVTREDLTHEIADASLEFYIKKGIHSLYQDWVASPCLADV